jgi:transposase
VEDHDKEATSMEKEDKRKISKEAKYELRKNVCRLVFDKKMCMADTAELLGMSYSGVQRIVSIIEKGGRNAIKLKKAGRRHGEKRVLSIEQETEIRNLIQDKRPEQIKMDFALWDRPAVRQLIQLKFSIKLPVRTVGLYLERWGFTPQKPIRKAYEQNPEAVKKWLDEEYPGIAERAKAEKAEIHWADETSIVNTDVRGRGYAPRGQTPVMKTPGRRERLSMISTVTNQGKTRWMIVDGNIDGDKLIEFLEALVRDTGKKVFVVMDNLRVHHCKPVKQWLSEHENELEAFYLPSYSPDLNPDERLNADLKQGIASRAPVRNKARLQEHATSHMQMLEKSPHRVKKYFEDPHVAYAA